MTDERKGTALLIAVAVVAVLAPLVLHYHEKSANHLRLAMRTARRDQALSLARCGVRLAMEVLAKDRRPYFFLPHHNPERPPVTEGRPSDLDLAYAWMERSRSEPLPFEGGRISIFIEDDQGRLPVNRCLLQSLAAFFSSQGATVVETSEILGESRKVDYSRRMAAAVLDWRDYDKVTTIGLGAEDAFYERAETPYRCRNSAFHSLGELSLLRDFDRRLLDKLQVVDKLTVFGPTFLVNVNTAPPAVLASLPGVIDTGSAADVVRELVRNRPYVDITALRTVVSGLDPGLWGKIFRNITLKSTRFAVTCSAETGAGAARVETVLLRRGEDFLVLSWKEY